jgi:hypothetical protein
MCEFAHTFRRMAGLTYSTVQQMGTRTKEDPQSTYVLRCRHAILYQAPERVECADVSQVQIKAGQLSSASGLCDDEPLDGRYLHQP